MAAMKMILLFMKSRISLLLYNGCLWNKFRSFGSFCVARTLISRRWHTLCVWEKNI